MNSNLNVRNASLTLALCLAPLVAGTPWTGGDSLAYQAETHFEMAPERLGVPKTLSDAKTVAVDARMSLRCNAASEGDGTMLSCTAYKPSVSWKVADDDVKQWAALTQKTLDGARIRVHLDDGHLAKVDLDTDESGPADEHWVLAKTVVERSLAGFDLPMPDDSRTTWEQHQTALVLPADPNMQEKQKIEHRATKAASGQTRVETKGEVSLLLEGNGDTVVDATDRIEGKVTAAGTWDLDEGHLVERTWRSDVGNGWYRQTGRLTLTGADATRKDR